MKAFRIGRKPAGIWTNRTPPIRGGVFQKLDALPSPPRTATPPLDECPDEKKKTAEEQDAFAAKLKTAAFIASAETADIDRDLRDYPSVDPEVQQDVVNKYRALHQRVHDEGFYNCPYSSYAIEMCRYTTLFTCSMVALYHQWYMTSAFFLGFFWQQIMFTAHDAGHCAITGNFTVDGVIAIFIADFCCGLSMGWWKRSHNVHHLITNHPVRSFFSTPLLPSSTPY